VRALLPSILVGAVLAAVSAAPAGSATDFPFEPEGIIVLRVGETLDASGPNQRCPAFRGYDTFRLSTTEGQPAGAGSACWLRAIAVPYADFFSMVLTLRLPGGTIEATPGSSLTFDGTAFPRFEGPDFCEFGYTLDYPLVPLVEVWQCEAPISSGTGVFQGATGWVTYSYVFRQNTEGVVTEFQPLTITIDFF
jgi:hypothetical protein